MSTRHQYRLLYALEQFRITYCAVIFEPPPPTARKKEHPVMFFLYRHYIYIQICRDVYLFFMTAVFYPVYYAILVYELPVFCLFINEDVLLHSSIIVRALNESGASLDRFSFSAFALGIFFYPHSANQPAKGRRTWRRHKDPPPRPAVAQLVTL